MSINRYDYIYDSEEPSDVAPIRLTTLFENIEDEVDKYVESHPSFNFDAYLRTIETHKQSIKTAGKAKKKQLQKEIRDLEWMTVHHRMEAKKNLLLWEHPRSVHSLKVTFSKGKEEWVGLVWYSKNQREPVELTDEYIRYLLTPDAYKKKCFRTGKFVPLQKYDRQATVDETHFRGVRKINQYQFQVVDCQGQRVTVTTRWACKNLPKESIKEAVMGSESNGFRLLPLGCPKANEKSTVDSTEANKNIEFPLTMYRNEGRQHKCMQKSFASALHFLGYHKEAALIGLSNLASSSQFDGFKSLVMETMKKSQWIVRYRKCNYQPFVATDRNQNAVIVSLKAAIMEEGRKVTVSINHSVCFVGDYVFDANRDHALPISVESLNVICDDIVQGSFYNGIYWDRELVVKGKACASSNVNS